MNGYLTTHPALRRMILLVLGILLISALLLGAQTIRGGAQGTQPDSSAPLSPDDGPHACTIANIAVFTTRIHVRCTTPAVVGTTNVYYFAASSDGANAMPANRFLTLMNTAYALGKPLYVYYFASTSSNPPGCNTSDCRGIDWMYIVP